MVDIFDSPRFKIPLKQKINVTCTKFNVISNCFYLKLTLLLFLIIILKCNLVNTYLHKHDDKILDACQRCKILVDSFKNGLKRTTRGKHEGGDAYWEEKNLNNYANSEIRLTDIQESLCNEVVSSKDQCHSFAEEYETQLEEWFLNIRKNNKQEQENEGSTLYEYLCNQISKVCCPDGHFGNECRPCRGFPDKICLNRGYCSGNGTRQGKGDCICHLGFDGESCEKCSSNYLSVGTIETELGDKIYKIPEQCVRCDLSCASTCHSLGPKGCHICKKGYFWDNDHGCLDIDECTTMELNPCEFNAYCHNTQGSYKCFQCHESCLGCTNRGSNSCIKCAPDFEKGNESECVKKVNKWPISLRYLFYMALTILIFFIAQSSILIGSCVSLLVTIVITFVEFPNIIWEYL